MKINWQLVDQFQQHFGWERSCERARNFMVAYISEIQRPLPILAAHAWSVAKEVRENAKKREECAKVITAMWKYIDQNEGSIASPDPNCCIMRALMCLLDDDLGSRETEPSIGDQIHWFLFFANKFEDRSNSAPSMIEQHFSLGPHLRHVNE